MSSGVDLTYQQANTASFEEALATLASPELAAAASTLSCSDRLDALAGLSDELLRRGSSLRSRLPAEGLAFLSAFLRRHALGELLERELPDSRMLQQFVPVAARKSLRYVPRGVVGHWVAGNVPLLAVFSWAVSAALGNRNVVRLSSRQSDVMTPLLQALEASGSAGAAIAGETLVVSFDRSDAEAHVAMSRACDVRIAWGGQEAVDAVRQLPAGWQCEDIVFGPRMSLAVVDPAVMDAASMRRLATDICVFDQLACSSPQVVFVKAGLDDEQAGSFAEQLAAALARQSAAYPRHPLDHAETFRIELDRSRAVLDGASVKRDAATQWTVTLSDWPNDKLDCANRFVQVVPAKDVDAVTDYLPRNVQTVVTALTEADFERFSEQAALRGACRLPSPGEGNNFDNPWDGVGLVSRLTRVVSRTDRARIKE